MLTVIVTITGDLYVVLIVMVTITGMSICSINSYCDIYDKFCHCLEYNFCFGTLVAQDEILLLCIYLFSPSWYRFA